VWDAIVIGSGISGLTAAAALARQGRRVLVLEQHRIAGGLTQTFRRGHWEFATGVHYVSGAGPGAGPGGQFRRLLDWLTGEALQFASCGNPYDIVRVPGFRFGIEHPESAYRMALLNRFPGERVAIIRWFDGMTQARSAASALFVSRALPGILAWALRLWRGRAIDRAANTTLADALSEVADPRLRAVLGARWGDYGAAPLQAPLLEHAIVTGAYNDGAWYPVGGPARFAATLQPVIEAAGGRIELHADVKAIELAQGKVSAVVFERGGVSQRETTQHVISTMGVVNTLACLEPGVAPEWRIEVAKLEPGPSFVALYLGFEGDITATGASAANQWIYESTDIGALWESPLTEDAPSLFVSFPSLKDPAQRGPATAEVLAFCGHDAFAALLAQPQDQLGAPYREMKARVEQRLLAQFMRHFPELAALIRFHELSTPLTQRRYVRTSAGAAYGLEMSAERLQSTALSIRTPVPGLLLAGQDVMGAGLQSASISGLLAAAAIEPALYKRLSG
jgi:all-trans-retinol 13,14-reductase